MHFASFVSHFVLRGEGGVSTLSTRLIVDSISNCFQVSFGPIYLG